MVSLTSFSTIALLIACGAIAAPWESNGYHYTHRTRGVGPTGVNLVSYHPPSIFETYGVDGAGVSLTGATPEEVAKSFLQDKLGVTADALTRHSGYTSDVASYEYFSQTINGIPVSNAVANVAIKGSKVVSYGTSFVKPKNVAPKDPSLSIDRAIALAEEAAGGKWDQWPVKLEYTAGEDGSCYLTHVIQVQGISDGSWKQLFIDAHNGQMRNVIDFVADASYQAVPLNYQDPKQNHTIVKDPEDKVSSPEGWYSEAVLKKPGTLGNNVASYKGQPLVGETFQSGPGQYHYKYDPNQEPEAEENKNAAVVNAFYVVNAMHDITYHYGFTEKSFNFQADNYDKGGQGNDPVLVSVQDGSGMNNANFLTPPDGQPGQMRMYLWDKTSPKRDGALENDIIVHEFTHGVSNRMTGGGTGRCLQTTEAGGMGEGWSDAMADITEAKSAPIPDFTLGSYVTGNEKGIRSHPYSTDTKINPLTYGSLVSREEVHAIGEVWALMLHELLAAFAGKYGLDGKFDPSAEAGNSIVLHLMMDGFALQPCNPTFISARDAILQAEANRYKGKYNCIIWIAFAKRGLGEDNMSVPKGC
ncbi:metalloprotease [Rhizoctonia solani]|nr:metalloprotease [Rhizoctonia solani]